MIINKNINEYTKMDELRYFLIVLYTLNVTDLIFTRILLGYGNDFFMEANIIMRPIINSVIAIILKLVLFGLVLLYWYRRSYKSNEEQLVRSIKLSKICTFSYSIINLSHILCMCLLFYIKFSV